ncbi:MAG: relaxase/mobilization nuclease domain-containing protein [Clostridiaceae bacterium]|nr:relaxase/mobilization nuclease domain-containing protein [Clostridiaceae bacterium]
MATTSIWPINGNISKVIRYVSNPDKTDLSTFSNQDIQSLKDVMDYAVNPSKTEQQYLVSGINCEPTIARQQMIITKQRFDKLDGRTAYHAYQSFKPGETDPQTAHRIGNQFAQQLWGDRFQVVVATHVDKEHIHNHFVINSVSFLDGKKFHSTCESYFVQMRTLSDQLCEQHGLSVIRDPPDGRATRSHPEWQAEKSDKPTWRGLIKQDVEEVISRAAVWSQFVTGLKEKGYDVKTGVKHVAVRPPGKERFIRLRSLGDDYSEDAIRQRLLNQEQASPDPTNQANQQDAKTENNLDSSKRNLRIYQPLKIRRPIQSFRHIPYYKKRKGYMPLYIRYLIQMGSLRPCSSTRRTHFLLREDIRYLDKITTEFRLITDKRLSTYADLLQYKQTLGDQVVHLMSERKGLQLQIKVDISDNSTNELKEKSQGITQQIRRCRRELSLCNDIQRRSLEMAGKLKQIRQEQSTQQQTQKEGHPHDQRR